MHCLYRVELRNFLGKTKVYRDETIVRIDSILL